MPLKTIYGITHGEADPVLLGLSNLQMYDKSGQIVRNLVTFPSGGLTTRFGTRKIAELTGATAFQMFGWRTGFHDYINILNNNSQIITYDLSDMSTTTMAHSFNTAVGDNRVDFSSYQNIFTMVARESQPIRITSTISDGSVSVSNVSFSNPPLFPYDKNYSDTVFTLSAVSVTDPDTAVGSLPVLEITSMGSFGGFNANFEGGKFEAIGDIADDGTLGVAEIVSYISSTQVRVRIDSEFNPSTSGGSTGKYLGKNAYLAETAYNSTRKWPAACTYYQDRQVFGGGGEVPQSIFASVTADYDNFDLGAANASDSVSDTIGTDEAHTIVRLTSASTLQVFTTTFIFSTDPYTTSAYSPTNYTLIPHTSDGSLNVKPIMIENQTLFAGQNKKSIYSFGAKMGEYRYQCNSVSKMSSHLINTPVDMASYVVCPAFASKFAFLINADGSLAIYQSLLEEDVSSWVSTSTYSDDKWLSVAVAGDRVFFITKRGTKYFLEEMDWNIPMDCATQKTGLTAGEQTIALGSDYASRTIVCANNIGTDVQSRTGNYIGSYEADASGNITVNIPSDGDYWFGLSFTQKLETMPIAFIAQNGDTNLMKKRISRVYVRVYKSYPFKVNGKYVKTQNLSTSVSDGIVIGDPIKSFTGIVEVPVTQGTGRERTVVIEQDQPLFLTILLIQAKLAD